MVPKQTIFFSWGYFFQFSLVVNLTSRKFWLNLNLVLFMTADGLLCENWHSIHTIQTYNCRWRGCCPFINRTCDHISGIALVICFSGRYCVLVSSVLSRKRTLYYAVDFCGHHGLQFAVYFIFVILSIVIDLESFKVTCNVKYLESNYTSGTLVVDIFRGLCVNHRNPLVVIW